VAGLRGDTQFSDGTASDSDSVDELSGEEADFRLVTRAAVQGAEDDEEVEEEEEEEEQTVQRSFLSSLGAGKYTASIRSVTENGTSRVKPYLQAAMFQELIRQDDVCGPMKLETTPCIPDIFQHAP
jgi:CO dehydrogenase/acetyl-CoA synthase beta subunit